MNYKKLKKTLAEKQVTQSKLADNISMSKTSLSMKMRGHRCFTLDEVRDIQDYLCLSNDDIVSIFIR